jgi:hypothetical protein
MADLHCWADGPQRDVLIDTETEKGYEGQWWGRLRLISSTCLLPDGHAGDHEFTPDDAITVAFTEQPPCK